MKRGLALSTSWHRHGRFFQSSTQVVRAAASARRRTDEDSQDGQRGGGGTDYDTTQTDYETTKIYRAPDLAFPNELSAPPSGATPP